MQGYGLNSLVVCFDDNNKWDSTWEHPFPKVSGYKRRSAIKEVDIARFRMCLISFSMDIPTEHKEILTMIMNRVNT